MKILEITEEIEKSLEIIYDTALKGSGIQVNAAIQFVRSAIKNRDGDGLRFLELDPETDKNLVTLCDVSLKKDGLDAQKFVQKLIDSIKDKA